MASDVDICNLALIRCKSTKLIASLADEGTTKTESALCAAMYPLVRNAVLEAADWDFARQRALLTVYAESGGDPAPPTNWLYSYLAPINMVKARSIVGKRNPTRADLIPYEVGVEYLYVSQYESYDAALIYTDEPDAELIYTMIPETTTGFSPLFVSAMAWGLALELNRALSKGQDENALRMNFERELARAAASNYGEGQVDVPNDSDFVREYQ